MAIQLEDAKIELNITWSDTDTDKKVQRALNRAEEIINMRAGRNVDFENDLNAQQLLFDCLRYIYSDSFNQFLEDYREELLTLRLLGDEGIEQKSSEENWI